MNLEELTILFSTTEEDFRRVREFGELVSPKIEDYIELFYQYLEKSLGPDFDIHFPDEDTLARAQSASRRAWLEFFEADWSDEYIASRERIGEVHAQLQVEPRHYLAAMNKSVDIWLEEIYDGGLDVAEWPAFVASWMYIPGGPGKLLPSRVGQ
jgi:rsbT co-antagonist protein RsbR